MSIPPVGRTTAPRTAAEGHPAGDDRFRLVDAAMRRPRYRRDALIEGLHSAQEIFGFLRGDVLLDVARGLELPPSRVFGVATFYHMFTLSPRGEPTCTVCTGGMPSGG